MILSAVSFWTGFILGNANRDVLTGIYAVYVDRDQNQQFVKISELDLPAQIQTDSGIVTIEAPKTKKR